MAEETLEKLGQQGDKYPNYRPENWYLSILRPKNKDYAEVAIRPLLNMKEVDDQIVSIVGNLPTLNTGEMPGNTSLKRHYYYDRAYYNKAFYN